MKSSVLDLRAIAPGKRVSRLGKIAERGAFELTIDGRAQGWRQPHGRSAHDPVEGPDRRIEVRPTVAIDAPVLAIGADLGEIEGGGDDRFLVLRRFGDLGAE